MLALGAGVLLPRVESWGITLRVMTDGRGHHASSLSDPFCGVNERFDGDFILNDWFSALVPRGSMVAL